MAGELNLGLHSVVVNGAGYPYVRRTQTGLT